MVIVRSLWIATNVLAIMVTVTTTVAITTVVMNALVLMVMKKQTNTAVEVRALRD